MSKIWVTILFDCSWYSDDNRNVSVIYCHFLNSAGYASTDLVGMCEIRTGNTVKVISWPVAGCCPRNFVSALKNHEGNNCRFRFWKEVFPRKDESMSDTRHAIFFYNIRVRVPWTSVVRLWLFQCLKKTTVLRNLRGFLFLLSPEQEWHNRSCNALLKYLNVRFCKHCLQWTAISIINLSVSFKT